jgi:Trp operon repressor
MHFHDDARPCFRPYAGIVYYLRLPALQGLSPTIVLYCASMLVRGTMRRLEEAFLALRSRDEAGAFLRMVLSDRERAWVERRWRAMLMKAVSGAGQREMGAKLHISVTTAGRGARSAQKYALLMEKMLVRLGLKPNRKPAGRKYRN